MKQMALLRGSPPSLLSVFMGRLDNKVSAMAERRLLNWKRGSLKVTSRTSHILKTQLKAYNILKEFFDDSTEIIKSEQYR